MKHFFIINPTAGLNDSKQDLIDSIDDALKYTDTMYRIQQTLCPKDATHFVKKMCELYQDEPLRFYACGGDGTLNEVVNGAVGFKNVEVGCIPCGTGNDFIKNFGASEGEKFCDIMRQVKGESMKIDLIRFGKQYAINLCNLGFDADIAFNMSKFKQLTFKGGPSAYTMSILYTLSNRMGNHIKVTLDDTMIIEQVSLLAVVGNGICYGGGYRATPLAKINDGWFDFCMVKNISRLKILNFIKYYKDGAHLEEPTLSKFIQYHKCKKILLEFRETVNLSVDGEISKTNQIAFEIAPNILSFIVPDGAI